MTAEIVEGNAPHYCPHCGYNLRADAVWEGDGFKVWPTGATYKGDKIPFTAMEANVFYSVAAANGQVVSQEVILDRAGSEATGNAVAVWMSRIRRKLEVMPIKPARAKKGKTGYYWAGVEYE